MPDGIIVFGPNGSGKSTFGRELAQILQFQHMDIEDYHFLPSKVPYTAARGREECRALMLADIRRYGSFVLSAVTGELGAEISALYRCAVWLSAPLDLRLARIDQRAYRQYGPRVRAGGDLYEQQRGFAGFVAARPLTGIQQWAETLTCPVLHVDGTRPVSETAAYAAAQYRRMIS